LSLSHAKKTKTNIEMNKGTDAMALLFTAVNPRLLMMLGV
jgi:hypothetical protein